MLGQSPLQLDLSRGRRTWHWRLWIILWACLLAGETILLTNNAYLDTLAWRSTRWFVGDRDKYSWADYHAAHLHDAAHFYEKAAPFASRFYKHSARFWEVAKTFGEPWTALVVVLLLATFDPRRWRAGATAAIAISLAGAAGALIRTIDGRYRPINIDGANRWALFRGFHDGSDLAHPSGHATVAFAAAAVLVCLAPRGRALFITLAALCAISRVVMGAHFWSDVILGAVLGWTLGWWISRLALRLLPRDASLLSLGKPR